MDNNNKHNLSDLQKRLLEMLAWFHDFCEKNHLVYYIIEGTALGAVRHQGFIPWDDDIDVGMPREDYNFLMNIFKQRINNYVLETPYSYNDQYIFPWCKLYDVNTTKIEHMRKEYKLGIYIDVFPLDGLGNSLIEARNRYKKIDFLNMFWATRVCAWNSGRSLHKNLSLVFSRIIPEKIISTKKLIQRIDKECMQISYSTSTFVSSALSTYRSKEIMEKEIYGRATKYKFEDIIVFGPEYPEKYLTIIYGDWMRLPPKEKQVSKHDYVYLDLNKSYLK